MGRDLVGNGKMDSNGTDLTNGSNNGRVRWGFGWNNEGNQGSNDVVSGIVVFNNYNDATNLLFGPLVLKISSKMEMVK